MTLIQFWQICAICLICAGCGGGDVPSSTSKTSLASNKNSARDSQKTIVLPPLTTVQCANPISTNPTSEILPSWIDGQKGEYRIKSIGIYVVDNRTQESFYAEAQTPQDSVPQVKCNTITDDDHELSGSLAVPESVDRSNGAFFLDRNLSLRVTKKQVFSEKISLFAHAEQTVKPLARIYRVSDSEIEIRTTYTIDATENQAQSKSVFGSVVYERL